MGNSAPGRPVFIGKRVTRAAITCALVARALEVFSGDSGPMVRYLSAKPCLSLGQAAAIFPKPRLHDSPHGQKNRSAEVRCPDFWLGRAREIMARLRNAIGNAQRPLRRVNRNLAVVLRSPHRVANNLAQGKRRPVGQRAALQSCRIVAGQLAGLAVVTLTLRACPGRLEEHQAFTNTRKPGRRR